MVQQVASSEKQTMNLVVHTGAPMSTCDKNLPFTDEERNTFRNEDFGAARIIVGIMGVVFTAGLALYIFIACMVAMDGH